MSLLIVGDTFGEQFEVVEESFSGGFRSVGSRGIDKKAKKPWEQTVFIKQYKAIYLEVGTEKANRLPIFYQALRNRLKSNKLRFCLPFYVGEANDTMVAVFHCIQGKSLGDWQNDGLSQEQWIGLALSISNSIRIMHKVGIIHLDLSPQNILIEENANTNKLYVKIIDFDGAQIDGVGLSSEIVGTVSYRSPEHIEPTHYGEVSEKSDVFTLGILLFELLFRQHPFPVGDYLTAVENSEISVPENTYHRQVVEKVLACLRPNPKTRPKAGWVHSTLYTHRLTNLEAVEPCDQWHQCVVLLEADNFQRLCYKNIHLGQNHFRGSGLENLPRQFLRLWLESEGASVELSDNGVNVSISGKQLIRDVVYPIEHSDLLTIDDLDFLVIVEKPESLARNAL
jgi:serine/threonine protein kinase